MFFISCMAVNSYFCSLTECSWEKGGQVLLSQSPYSQPKQTAFSCQLLRITGLMISRAVSEPCSVTYKTIVPPAGPLGPTFCLVLPSGLQGDPGASSTTWELVRATWPCSFQEPSDLSFVPNSRAAFSVTEAFWVGLVRLASLLRTQNLVSQIVQPYQTPF